jgi:hypothetical protein
MYTCTLALCAESAIRDAQTNVFSLINIIEELPTPALPALLAKCTYFFRIEKEPVDPLIATFRLVLRNNEHVLSDNNLVVDFENKQATRLVAAANGLIVANPGTLTAVLYFGEATLGHWRVPITVGAPMVVARAAPG